MNIYVGNLPYSMTDGELQDMFAPHGVVASVRVVTDRDTGRAKGFAFVEMNDATEAQAAIEALNGVQQGGRTLVVNEARPRDERPARSGGFGGGRERSSFGGGRNRF